MCNCSVVIRSISIWCSNQSIVVSAGLSDEYESVGSVGFGLGIASGLLCIPMGIGILILNED